MARYDKYDPYSGGFRAPLAAAIAAEDSYKPYAVGLNSSGQVVLGAGTTGIRGILIAHGAKSAGDIVDVMTHGDIVEFAETSGTAATAGSSYGGMNATGVVTKTTPDAALGFTVEADRLVVRV